jgi:hypothetical protein
MIELAGIELLTVRCCILRRLRERVVLGGAAGHREGQGWQAAAGRDGGGVR